MILWFNPLNWNWINPTLSIITSHFYHISKKTVKGKIKPVFALTELWVISIKTDNGFTVSMKSIYKVIQTLLQCWVLCQRIKIIWRTHQHPPAWEGPTFFSQNFPRFPRYVLALAGLDDNAVSDRVQLLITNIKQLLFCCLMFVPCPAMSRTCIIYHLMWKWYEAERASYPDTVSSVSGLITHRLTLSVWDVGDISLDILTDGLRTICCQAAVCVCHPGRCVVSVATQEIKNKIFPSPAPLNMSHSEFYDVKRNKKLWLVRGQTVVR